MSANDYKLQGNKAFAAKDFNKAIELFGKAIEIDPTNHVFFSNRSGAYINLGKNEEALADANKCIELNPQFVKGYARKGLALRKQGKYDEAQKVYEEGLTFDPENGMIKTGMQELQTEKSGGAQGGQPGGLPKGMDMNMIMQLMQNPQIQKLMKENPQLVQQIMKNPDMFLKNPQMMNLLLGQMGGAGGNPGGFGGATNPNNFQGFGNTNTQSPPPPETKPETAFQKPTPTPPPKAPEPELSEFEKLKKEGNNLYKKKDFEAALKKYDEAKELDDPNVLLVWNNMAACMIQLKNYEGAIAHLEVAIKKYHGMEPSKRQYQHIAKLYARRGRAYFLQDDLDNAIKSYKLSLTEVKIASVERDLKEAKSLKKKREALAYINPELSEEHRQKGNAFFKQGEFAKAIGEYEEAVRRNPKDAKIFNNKALCFIKMLKFNQASKEVDKALELDPDFLKARIQRARIYGLCKEYHKALEEYQKILKVEPNNQTAKTGLMEIQMKIANQMGGQQDNERAQRAMQDPEIQRIINDPMVRLALQRMQENPKLAQQYISDPELGPKIQKLIAAGILKTA